MRAWCLLLLLLPGCYTVRFYDGDVKAAGAEKERSYQLWTHSLFWGMVPITRVDVSLCDHGILKMKSQIGGLGLLAYALTGGIWTPMHVKLVCADPASRDETASEPSTEEKSASKTPSWLLPSGARPEPESAPDAGPQDTGASDR